MSIRTLAPERIRLLATIPGNASARECRLLFALAAQAQGAGQIVEIGAFKGKSTAWLAEAARHTGRRLVSIDPHLRGSDEEFRETARRLQFEDVATLHKAYSHDIGKDWREPIAFLWVDGGHDYECVRQDILDFTPHLEPGGVVVFDDANAENFPGVVRALDETLRRDPAFESLGQIKTFALFRRKKA